MDQSPPPPVKLRRKDAVASGIFKNFFSPLGRMSLKIAGCRRLNWIFFACSYFLTLLYYFLRFTRFALKSGKNITAFEWFSRHHLWIFWRLFEEVYPGPDNLAVGWGWVWAACLLVGGTLGIDALFQLSVGRWSVVPEIHLAKKLDPFPLCPLLDWQHKYYCAALILQLVYFIHEKFLLHHQAEDTGVQFS